MVRAVVFSGYKGSGKTSAIEGVVKELVKRGYDVGTIKHIPQDDFTLDQPETDTWRHAKSGSKKVIALSPNQVTTLEKREANLRELLLGMEDLDFVILEGFKKSEDIARVVIPRDEEEIPKLADEFTIGFIGIGDDERSILDSDNYSGLADLVEEKAVMVPGGLDCGECGHESCREFVLAAINGNAPKDGCAALKGSVSLYVDERRVPLKSFVQDLIKKTISGMVSSLSETEGGRIKIEVDRDEG